jgi:hypothetical protein
MPPPPSFITISSIPFSRVVTQAEFNGGTFGGVANEVWFKFPSNAIPKTALGSFCNKGGTFTPQTRLYDSDGTTILRAFVNGDKGWYQVIDSTTDKYIQIVKTTGGASDFNFTVQFDTRVVNNTVSLQNGDILENDDQGGPAFLMGADGTFRTFLDPFSSGEYSDILPDNISLWDGNAHGIDRQELYNLLTFFDSVNIVNESLIIASDTEFFLCRRTSPHEIYRVTEGGVSTLLGTLPAGAVKITGFGVSRDGSIIYWGRQSGDANIHRWDTASGTPLTDLYTIPGYDVVNDRFSTTSFNNGGRLITLPDNSVLFWWFDFSSLSYNIVHLDAAGTLINSFNQGTALSVNHLAKIKNSTTDIVVWYIINADGNARYAHYNFITGIIIDSFDKELFINGVNINVSSPTMFGPATSCIPVVFVLAAPPLPPNPGSGIYKLVPGKYNDTLWNEDLTASFDTKIPNPFGKTGLLGE